MHLATPEPSQEAKARAVLLEGSDFLYTFSNHTVSGELDTDPTSSPSAGPTTRTPASWC